MLNFAIIGFGGLGKRHFLDYPEYNRLSGGDVKLVAICDVEKKAFTTQTSTNLGVDNFDYDLSEYTLYTDVDELLKNEKLDFVITALPTYLHAEIAIKAMNKGISVFSEKPMAISVEQGQSMIDAANANNVRLMIGQCVRYAERSQKIKEIIDSKKYGKVLRVHFDRLSQTPLWGWQNWFLDEAKSGSAPLDLHVHDVDFINYLFGMPKAVHSVATNYKEKHDSIVTMYDYDNMVVTATGEWGCPDCFPFTLSTFVKMEKATIDMREGKLILYEENGGRSEIELEEKDEYVYEVVDFIDCVKNNKPSIINPPEASLASIKIALAEKESADKKQTVSL